MVASSIQGKSHVLATMLRVHLEAPARTGDAALNNAIVNPTGNAAAVHPVVCGRYRDGTRVDAGRLALRHGLRL